MNKTKIVVFLTLTSCLMGLASCGGYTDSKVKSHSSKNVPLYKNFNDASPLATFEVTHFNDSPVGYVKVKSAMEIYQSSNFGKAYSTKDVEHTTLITNSQTNATLVIDYDKETFTYSNFDKYCCSEDPYVPYMDIMISGAKELFINANTKAKYNDQNVSKTINMRNYNIPIYMYNGDGYIPLDLLRSFLFPDYEFHLFYNGVNLYMNSPANIDANALRQYKQQGNIFTADYMEYTYNLLALNLDTWYGLDQKTYECNGKTVKYLEGGAYNTISPYHDRLVSLEANVSDKALSDLFKEKLDDGGHTGVLSHNCMIGDNPVEFGNGPESSYKADIGQKLADARKEAHFAPNQVVKEQTGKDNKSTHSYEEVDDTAFLTFDEFTNCTDFKADINLENYWQNTIYTVCFANYCIKNNTKIKNLVIDMSINGGGAIPAMNFLGSWLCSGFTTKARNVKDKSYQETTVYADINRDGKLDDNDYLSKDINVYVIQSAYSYSCAGMLPCLLKDQSNVKFIGGRSGGGSCEAFNYMPTGLGSFFQLSSPYQFGRLSSNSYSDFTSIEDGVNADFYQIGYGDEEIENFYDRATILEKIHQK